MREHVLSAAQVNGRKIVHYACRCCGTPFISGRSKEDVLCFDCVAIRRILRDYGKRLKVDNEEVIKRVEFLFERS